MKKKKKKKRKSKKKSLLPRIEIKADSNFTVFEVVIFIFISLVFGMIAGCLLTYHNSSLSTVRSNSNLREIISTYTTILDNYYDEIDENKLTNSAVKGMINSLDDPYSIFLEDASADSFAESIDGRYVGIGMSIVFEKENFRVVSVTEDGPAYIAGIKENDIIISIDGVDCHNLTSSDLRGLIKGKVGKEVDVKVLRGDKYYTFKPKRKYIEIMNVSSEVIEENDKSIGYISLSVFASNSYDQFSNALTLLEEKKIDSLIIDLRNNPGGHLNQAKKTLELFLPKREVLYQIEKNKNVKKVYSGTKESRSYPIVILINSSTASASEVFTISMKENYKNITLVGSTSYGKGTIQKSQTLSTGTSIKYTIEKWLSPNGIDVNDVGIVPDVQVLNQSEDDSQLHMAIDKLK